MEEKIYVDAGQPATLIDGATITECPTLQEAVIAWHHLPKERQGAATIKSSGKIYAAQEISRLYYGPEPVKPPIAQPDPSHWMPSSTWDDAAQTAVRQRLELAEGIAQPVRPPNAQPDPSHSAIG